MFSVRLARTHHSYLLGKPISNMYGPQTLYSSVVIFNELNAALAYYSKKRCCDDHDDKIYEYHFNYSLSLLEFIKEESNLYDFKIPCYIDLDVLDADMEADAKQERLQLCMDYLRRTIKGNYYCWFTGKKGFRIVCTKDLRGYLQYWSPSFDGKEFIENILLEKANSVVCPSPSDYEELETAEVDHTIANLLFKKIDTGVWYKGRGVKFDVRKHPESKKFPRVIVTDNVNSECNSIVNGYLCCRCSMIFIIQIWTTIYKEILIEVLPNLREEELEKIPNDKLLLSSASHTLFRPGNARVLRTPDMDTRMVQLKYWNEQPYTLRSHFGNKNPTWIIQHKDHGVTFSFCEDKYFCEIHGKIHASYKSYFSYNPVIGDSVFCHCFSTKLGILSNPYTVSLRRRTDEEGEATYTVDKLFRTLSEDLRNLLVGSGSVSVVEDDFIGDRLWEDPVLRERKFIFVKSAMGSGKSQAVKTYLEKTSETSKRVLVICTRITCANFMANTFGCASYTNLSSKIQYHKNQLPRMDKLVISMESLHKIYSRNADRVAYCLAFDVIILDEIESILQTFTSSTMNERRNNFDFLRSLLESSRDKVFIMDALLSSLTLEYFHNIGAFKDPLKYAMIFNQKNQDTTKYRLYQKNQFSLWLNTMIKRFRDGKKIVFVSDSKKILQTVSDEVLRRFEEKKGMNCDDAGKKILIITGASSMNDKYTSVHTNLWQDLDFIAYSPVITVGNSYSPDDIKYIKDDFFGFFKGSTLASTCLQMCGRFRKVRSGVKHIFFSLPGESTPLPPIEMIGNKRKHNKIMDEREKYICNDAKYLLENKVLIVENELDIISLPKIKNEYRELISCNFALCASSFVNIEKEFIRCLKEANLLYEEVEVEGSEISSKWLECIKKKSREPTKISNTKPTLDTTKYDIAEKLIALGAPTENRDMIVESVNAEICSQFQSSHFLDVGTLLFSFYIHNFSDATEVIFQEEFSKIEKNCSPHFLVISRVVKAVALFADFFKDKDYVSYSELPLEMDKAINEYFADFRLMKHLIYFGKIYGYNKITKLKGDRRALFRLLCKHHLPRFGIALDDIGIEKFRKINPGSTRYTHRINTNLLKNLGRECYYTGTQKRPAREIIIQHNLEKTRNTLLLANHKFRKDPLPDTYPFKQFFLSSQPLLTSSLSTLADT